MKNHKMVGYYLKMAEICKKNVILSVYWMGCVHQCDFSSCIW